MNILGISAFYHDSAAALVQDGVVTAAAQEERFTRKKHDADFPVCAVRSCLDLGGIQPQDVDYIVFYDKPVQKFDRLLETYLAFAPAGFHSFMMAMPLWLTQKLYMRRELRQGVGAGRPLKAKILFTAHHEAHAASAFFPSPFAEAAVLTMDGVGEWATASIGKGSGNRLELLKEMHFPHSLGLLYSAFTYYCGFKVNSGEYKLMGLAPYGRPRFRDLILDTLVDLRPDGSLWMDMRYFNYCQGLTMTNARFAALLGRPARSPESRLDQHYMDVAASIQSVCEEAVLNMARHARELTGLRHLCLAGGVALNCVANGKLLRSGLFDDLWIQPASGDAGGALGAALFAWHQLADKPRVCRGGPAGTAAAEPCPDGMHGALLGPAFTMADVRRRLDGVGAVYQACAAEDELLDQVVAALDAGKIVGWCHGRMEFGPRALGSRSILGDARNPEMQAKMNLKIKFRESFRPFAPIVMREHVHKYFVLDRESPYMLLVAPVREALRTPLSPEQKQLLQEDPDLCRRVNVTRSSIPAVTHVDYSARIQTVDAVRHPRLHRLMARFAERTGSHVLVNTSFNIRGEPIVCTPEDAYRCFVMTDMDVLVVEDALLLKPEQPASATEARKQYLSTFGLD